MQMPNNTGYESRVFERLLYLIYTVKYENKELEHVADLFYLLVRSLFII